MEGDEIVVDVEALAFNDKFEWDGSVHTAVKLRERLTITRGNRYLLLRSDMMSSLNDWQAGH